MFDWLAGVRGVVKPNRKALSEAIQAIVDLTSIRMMLEQSVPHFNMKWGHNLIGTQW